MSPEEYIPALQRGRSALLSGFKSKEGKAFDAYLVWDAKAKKFSFAFLEKKSPGVITVTFDTPLTIRRRKKKKSSR
jgi:hypothetical protein